MPLVALTREVSRAIARCELTHLARSPIDASGQLVRLDSLMIVDLVIALEEAAGMQIPATALSEAAFRSVDTVARLLADLRSVSAEKVPVKVAGKELMIDATAGKSDALLVRFSKVSTWREAYDVQGVTIEKAQLKVGDEDHTGKGRLKLAEKDGKWIVQSMEVE